MFVKIQKIRKENQFERFKKATILMDNMDKKEKTKIEIETDVLNKLIKLKKVGDSYSDVIRELLKNA